MLEQCENHWYVLRPFHSVTLTIGTLLKRIFAKDRQHTLGHETVLAVILIYGQVGTTQTYASQVLSRQLQMPLQVWLLTRMLYKSQLV